MPQPKPQPASPSLILLKGRGSHRNARRGGRDRGGRCGQPLGGRGDAARQQTVLGTRQEHQCPDPPRPLHRPQSRRAAPAQYAQPAPLRCLPAVLTRSRFRVGRSDDLPAILRPRLAAVNAALFSFNEAAPSAVRDAWDATLLVARGPSAMPPQPQHPAPTPTP